MKRKINILLLFFLLVGGGYFLYQGLKIEIKSQIAQIFLKQAWEKSLITKKVIKERLGSQVGSELTVEEIVKRVSETTKIKQKDIVGISRKMEITEARQISIYLCREILGTPLVSIGMHFGGRDHSTVLHACRVIEKRSKKDERISNLVGGLKSELTFAKS